MKEIKVLCHEDGTFTVVTKEGDKAAIDEAADMERMVKTVKRRAVLPLRPADEFLDKE